MNLIEKLFALRNVPPFDALRDGELGLVAEVAKERTYRPGQIVVQPGTVLSRLIVAVEGRLVTPGGEELPTAIGLHSLLFDAPLSCELVAGEEAGAHCLTIQKGHFFTILNDCPAFVVGLLPLAHREGICEAFDK